MSYKNVAIAALFSTILMILVLWIGQKQLTGSELDWGLFWDFRLPMVVLALTAGAVLGSGGFLMQILFKNDLATPYTLGISSGSVFALMIGIQFFNITSPIFSLLGALLLLWVLYRIIPGDHLFIHRVLLIGIGLNIFFSSGMMLLHYFADMRTLYRLVHWLVGSIQPQPLLEMVPIWVVLILEAIYIIRIGPKLDLIGINHTLAQQRGISVTQIYKTLLIFQGVLLGLLLPLTGPVAFIGLIIPNVIRLAVTGSVKKLFFLSVWGGALFLVLAHWLSMRLLPGEVLPVGVITAVIGSLFLIITVGRQGRTA